MDAARVVSVLPNSWPVARDLLSSMRHYVYRGHADADWNLSSTLERAADRLRTTERMAAAETEMLQQFQRRAHQYLSVLPPLSDTLAWLALIQHYGGPTRLVDFTRSPYVAAFFAMDAAVKDAAVWAFNEDALLAKTNSLLGSSASTPRLVRDPTGTDLANDALRKSPPLAGVIFEEPFLLDERISHQQGCFLVPLDLNQGFDDNLNAAFGIRSVDSKHVKPVSYDGRDRYLRAAPPTILKIILPRRLHPDAMLDLEAMNVTSTSLFGGLDGFARSLPGIMRAIERSGYEWDETRSFFSETSQLRGYGVDG